MAAAVLAALAVMKVGRKMNNNDIRIDTVTAEVLRSPSHDIVNLKWTGNLGFGEYTLYSDNGMWRADSEHMDAYDSNKTFLKQLLNKFADTVDVVS